MITAEVTIRAQFYDLDPMQVVWHGNYVRFLEQARCALLDKIEFNYEAMALTGYSWPVVDLRIKYVKPLRFAQEARVRATLVEYENRLRIDYVISDPASGEIVTKAQTIQVAVDMATGELAFESPQALRDSVERHR
ncbi:MAG TPA: thioesterase family protein [Stellaceae bacterium]|jgi:acyl-CoA thioester hydrolase|nr:thioesterase family protein [Stellaceae bacterium]